MTYWDKALNNLELAGVLELLYENNEAKKSVGISIESEYHDWIIIVSYYAMYLAAISALAKLGVKTLTHKATLVALEYRYCVEKNLLSREYIEMIEDASFGREDIQNIIQVIKGREIVQYTIYRKYGIGEAKRILKDAKKFVNKLSEIVG